jgi:hypothetical protein
LRYQFDRSDVVFIQSLVRRRLAFRAYHKIKAEMPLRDDPPPTKPDRYGNGRVLNEEVRYVALYSFFISRMILIFPFVPGFIARQEIDAGLEYQYYFRHRPRNRKFNFPQKRVNNSEALEKAFEIFR